MINLINVTYKADNILILDKITIDFSREKCWAITGDNGSGKSILAMILAGLIKPYSGETVVDEKIGYASFELQQKIMEEEQKRDNSRFMQGSTDPGTLVKSFISNNKNIESAVLEKYISFFNIEKLLDRGLRYLSTGEFRKVMLCKALADNPDVLIIDDPYDGLDIQSREDLSNLIELLIKQGERIFLVTPRFKDISFLIKNVVVMQSGEIKYSGNIENINKNKESQDSFIYNFSKVKWDLPAENIGSAIAGNSENEIIFMQNVSVAYNDRKIISDINWIVNTGERWKISGPNGSGKSTLMSLINGDNPKAYSNNIRLFGKQKGSGESIWEIKKRIGFVSGDFQMNFRARATVLETVLSGFFDSIGLYNTANGSQTQEAIKWLQACGLIGKKDVLLNKLSYGEKRVVLIIRAFIKKPQLLILDEPCQGLDEQNTLSVISLIEELSKNSGITMLFITHDPDICPKSFNKNLVLIPYKEGGFTAETVNI